MEGEKSNSTGIGGVVEEEGEGEGEGEEVELELEALLRWLREDMMMKIHKKEKEKEEQSQ